MPPGPGGLGGGTSVGGMGSEPSMPDLFNELSITSGNNVDSSVGGSRLLSWKNNSSDGGLGSLSSKGSGTSKGGLGFGGDDTWGLPSNSSNSVSGWPDSKPTSSVGGSVGVGVGGSGGVDLPITTSTVSGSNTDTLNGMDTFGIPEFVPGKAWKGPGLKNPDEDPTLTPGSVAPTAIDLIKNHNSSTSSTSGSALAENTLGLTSPTWSFNNPTSTDNKMKDSWGAPGTGGSGNSGVNTSTSTLTPMGQDLWGKSGRTPPGLGGWPSTTVASNGWSSGQNGANGSSNPNNPAESPCWLLLKNLTPQIDGSTLKTLCIQHGPLNNFHLFLNNGIALVMYTTGREATKAQKALNNCLLGNTTIQANITSEVCIFLGYY